MEKNTEKNHGVLKGHRYGHNQQWQNVKKHENMVTVTVIVTTHFRSLENDKRKEVSDWNMKCKKFKISLNSRSATQDQE